MNRVEYNVTTGQVTTIALTPQEIAALPSPQPPVVPQTVTRFQARAALSRAGLFLQVDQAMKAFPAGDERRLAWEDAQTFERTSPTMLMLAASFGMTPTQLDQLFTVAASISA